MIRNTYTGRDGLPYFFPMLGDELEEELDSDQAHSVVPPVGDSNSPAGVVALPTIGPYDEERAAPWLQQAALTRAGNMSATDDPLLLRTRLQADLPFNSWQRSVRQNDEQNAASWSEHNGQPVVPAMYGNQEDMEKLAAYTGALADTLQKHKRLDMPPPGLNRAQEAIWVQRQMIKNDFGLDETQFPNADYADFAKVGSPYYSKLTPENLRKLQWYVSQHIANSPEPPSGSIREWSGPQLRNLQNLKVADNVLTGSAAVACRGAIPDCDLAIRQANLLNGKDGDYGMNIDFHLAKKDEPVALTMDIMDDGAFQKIAGKDTGGDYLNGVIRLPRNHDYITTKHEVLHALGRGHEKFKNLDLSSRPGIMSYASDFIRSPGPNEKDYKILVDNYRNYPVRQEAPRSIWDFWRK